MCLETVWFQFIYLFFVLHIYTYIRGVTIHVFILNRSLLGFWIGMHYKSNNSLD